MYKILINLTYIFIKYKFRIKIYLLFHQALLEIMLIMLCKIKKYQNYVIVIVKIIIFWDCKLIKMVTITHNEKECFNYIFF